MMTDKEKAQLSEFASAAWGKPRAFIKELGDGPAKFEYIDLGKYFPVFESFFAGTLIDNKILIRQEYRDTFKELEKDKYYHGVCVTGQPGIGKTLFNVYIIITRLGAKKAVAVQFMNGEFMYALFQTTVHFYSLNNADPLDIVPSYKLPFAWALCDSNHTVEQPAGIFYGRRDKVRIIQTTSPKASRWKQWTKQHHAELFVMDIWSESEIKQLGTMLALDVDRMVGLASKWGRIPRVVLKMTKWSDEKIERIYRKSAEEAVRDSPQLMASAGLQNLPSDPPSPFFFLRPLDTDEGRGEFYIHVPTKTLWQFLGQALQGLSNGNKLAFYEVLSQYDQTRTSAGNVYESWFHGFVIARREISCTWLSHRNVKLSTTWKMPDPVDADTHQYLIPSTLEELRTRVPPYYWVSPNRFPGIDGLLVLTTAIYAFQVTISSTHRSPEEGLKRIQKKFPANLKELPLGLVFVGPQEGASKEVANGWKGRVYLSGRKVVPVAWSALDPALQGVEYKAFRDAEDMPVFEESEESEEPEEPEEPEEAKVATQSEHLGDQTVPEGPPAKRTRASGRKDKKGKQRGD